MMMMPDPIQPKQPRIKKLQWELVQNLSHSLDLAPSDFHLFGQKFHQ
jgi:hypothetical protein